MLKGKKNIYELKKEEKQKTNNLGFFESYYAHRSLGCVRTLEEKILFLTTLYPRHINTYA